MSEAVTATRAQIQIGSITVDGFMLPDGSYRMSQTQAAECVGKPEINARRFLTSKSIKSLLGKDYTPDTIKAESEANKRGQARFNALPLEVVTAYWINQCFQGNSEALALVMALATESLERRFDDVFGVPRSESERNERLTQQMRQIKEQMEQLGEAYAEPDILREEVEHLKEQIRSLGAEPWELPRGTE